MRILAYLPLASRLVLASVGAYLMATLAALACLSLPMDEVSRVYWGYFSAIVVCAAVIILAFSTNRVWVAWLIVLVFGAVFGLIWQMGR